MGRALVFPLGVISQSNKVNKKSMLDEYETNEVFEMTYLYFLGFPHEFDRTNPRKVKMIFKGDPKLIKSLLEDFWDNGTKVDARKILNASKEIKKSLWVGGAYNPSYYAKQPVDSVVQQIKENEASHIGATDQQEKL